MKRFFFRGNLCICLFIYNPLKICCDIDLILGSLGVDKISEDEDIKKKIKKKRKNFPLEGKAHFIEWLDREYQQKRWRRVSRRAWKRLKSSQCDRI